MGGGILGRRRKRGCAAEYDISRVNTKMPRSARRKDQLYTNRRYCSLIVCGESSEKHAYGEGHDVICPIHAHVSSPRKVTSHRP